MVDFPGCYAPLFVPGDRPDRFHKAAGSNADCIIIDLEDAVASERKSEARNNLRTDFADLPIVIRINGVDAPWHDADLGSVYQLNPSAVMLPKAEDPEIVSAIGRRIPIVPLIETAIGLSRVRDIARSAGVVRLAFGTIDFCAELGIADRSLALLPARFELVMASKLAGLAPPWDGITPSFTDPDEIRADALLAKASGMGGKLCIHPAQTSVVRDAFRPSDQEIIWASKILSQPEGASAMSGEMVDEATRAQARTVMSRK